MSPFNEDRPTSPSRAWFIHGAWLVLGWAALLVAATLLLYRIPLDSDRLYFDHLFADLRAGGAWSDWRLALAPGYFPDLVFYGLAERWLPTPAWRLFAVTVTQVLACAGAALFILRQLLPGRVAGVATATLGVFGLTVLVGTRTDAWLFLNDNNAHVGATLCSLLCTGLLMRYLRRASTALLPTLALVVAAGWLSTQLFALTFIVPVLLLLSCAARWMVWLRPQAVAAAVAIVAGALVGHVTQRWVTANGAIAHKLKYSFEALAHAVHTLGNTVQGLLHQPLVGLVLTVMLLLGIGASAALVVGFSRRRQWVSEPAAPEAADRLWTFGLALYALTSLAIVLTGSLLSGGFADDKSIRYLQLPLALVALGSMAMLAQARPRLLAWGGVVACVMCLAWSAHLQPVLRSESGGADFMQMGRRGIGRVGEEKVAQCLDTAKQQGLVLEAGASQYWFARGVSYFAGGVPMFSIFSDMHPFFWMSTMGPMRHPDHYRYRFNFLIVQVGGELEPFHFTPEEVGAHAPKPDRIWRCTEAPVQLWWYADDRLDTLLRRQAAIAEGG
jgi:hypothetical protein